ncbi:MULTISPECIES: alpha/beta hydrolase [Marinobacter]|uniref:Lysophospholipase n=1 Tax=Marinobacter excellens LAMA 842 TaxID=1306954 RepID=A0A137SF88_9GAMM|nr:MULTISPECIES: alpha/beta hydrolase [Marinobacter]KXO11101.1 Lysophospholipase [Marinobacter excellens LAMA 842]MCD1628996.1 alpha/beta hydrolase [Marinobacter shengliensis]PSF12786.1 alpha/beta hydrolase [Marinobacter shengliensis]WBU40222.1 alpha/beta hydrolase [Marinobacter alkaliphilus]
MYWKTDTIEIPNWDRHSLLDRLEPFDPAINRELSVEMEAYCRFYGLDLWVEHPEVTYHQGYIKAERHEVMVHYFRLPESSAPKGTVFILHGYFDHVGLYTQLIDRCLGAGFDVLAYDQPGHGLSSGTPAAIGSFLEYQAVLSEVMAHVRDKIRGPWFAVGQSTGGAILIDYLLSNHHNRETSDFRRVVLLAPLVRPMGWLGAKILHSLVKPFLTRWRRVFGANSGNARFLDFLREHDPLQARAVHVDWVTALRKWVPHIESARPVDFPVTVVQGEKDLTVDWQHNLRIIRNKFASVREQRIPDGRHHLVNEAQDLQATVFNTIIDTFAE